MVLFGRLWCVLVLGCLGLVVGVAQGQARRGGPPPANVVVDAVRLERLVQRRVVTGEIRSRLSSTIASQVDGLLLELLVDAGDVVQAGEVIARLDDERARINLERARADEEFAYAVVVQREAELASARRDLGRLEELTRSGSSGVSQLDEAKTLVAARGALLAQSQAELASSSGSLRLAERELEDMSIKAPFRGRVVSKQSEVGQWVGRGDEIVMVVSVELLEARVDIPEDVYGAVRDAWAHGERIEIALPAIKGRVFGEIIAILPNADSLSRLFGVRIGVSAKDSNGENMLRPGMSLSAWVPTGERGDFVTVSKDAIVRKASGEIVYYSNDGVSAVAPVTRLFASGDRVAVRSHVLQDGMLVVVKGNERLRPGQVLDIQAAAKDVIQEIRQELGGDHDVEPGRVHDGGSD